MIESLASSDHVTSTNLRIGIGFSPQADGTWSVVQAAALARSRFGMGQPNLALICTTQAPTRDVVAAVQAELGSVAVAGGSAAGLFTDHGLERTGSVVICVGNAESATSGAVMASGQDLADAGQMAARVMLAGWPFRMHYPRGIGIAMARQGMPARDFLEPWRRLMGPKMRTVCGVQPGPALFAERYGRSTLASVACLEGPYATGLGYTDVAANEGGFPDVQALIHGAIDATRTAMKRLEGLPARLVLVMESEARQRALGNDGGEEWAAIRAEAGDASPCVGWVCERVAAYGRGVRPVDAERALVVVAIGDITRKSMAAE